MADKERKLKWLLWADAQKFNAGLKQAKGGLSSFEKSAKSMFSNFAATMGVALSVGAIANFTKELAKISGEVEGVSTAFGKMASTADLQGLRNSVKGTVSDLQLMKMAVSANVLGLPVKELGNLFEFAAKMAQDTGQSVDYLVDSVVRGIGRKSALILDNLGISAIALKEALGGISVEAASVGQVTQAVSKIANDYLNENGRLLDTNATKIQRITAEWENFKATVASSDIFTNSLSELFTEVEMLVSGYAGFGDLLKGVFNESGWDKLRDNFANWKQVRDWNEKYGGMYGEGESTKPGPAKKALSTLTDDENKKAKTAYEKLTEKIAELTKKRQDLALANKDITDITAQINGLNEQKNAVDELIKSLDPKSPREFREEMQRMFDQAIEVRKTLATTFTQRYDRPIIAATSAKEAAKYEPIDTGQLADMGGLIEANTLKAETAMMAMRDTTIDIGREIEGVFQGMAVGIGESLGNMIAGVEGYDNAGNMILGVLADLAIQVGQIAVGVGVATLGIKEALESLNPVVAIAAGTALIALGTAAKGMLRSAAGGGSSSGVYDTRSFASQQQMMGLQANAMRIEVVGETQIRNKDIYIAYKNAETGRKLKT